ncbi:hypothetical protein XF30_11180 [Bradyrhizobium sp. SUTN9-2]|nr:hypothetical protein XF30_11180 [Bradyrhizobium sp. SUTN9-2]
MIDSASGVAKMGFARVAGTLFQDLILDWCCSRGYRHRNTEKRGQTLDGQHRRMRQNMKCAQTG